MSLCSFFFSFSTQKDFFFFIGQTRALHTLTRNTFFTTSDSKRFSYHKKYPELLKFRVLKRATIYYGIHVSSHIQTLLSVPEFHRFNHLHGSRTVTAGRELHPAPKNPYLFSITLYDCVLYYSSIFL